MQSSLCLQYLRNARMSKAIESKLWMAIHAFYWEITRSYHGFLMDFVSNPGGSKTQAFIPLITSRAIRGFADIIKWRYFRYESIDEKLWLRLHNLYRISEFDNFSTTKVSVYRGDLGQHSPAEEYGQTLLLSLLCSGNLLPREIEMVDRWLDNWSDLIRIDTLFAPERHVFYVDTSQGYGLRRCRNQGTDPNLRFISTQPLIGRMGSVRDKLKAGAAPATLGLTEDFRLPEGYTLLNQIELQWGVLHQRDRRASSRLPETGEWKIIRELPGICAELEKFQSHGKGALQGQLSPEEILDIKLYGFVTERTREKLLDRERDAGLPHRAEVWEQLDMSENGLGFAVDSADSDWIKVGKLLAVVSEDWRLWRLGVVSRLARQDEGSRLVGLRLITDSFLAARIKPDNSSAALGYVVDDPETPGVFQAYPAILLSSANGTESLLIESSRYSRDRPYMLRTPQHDSRMIRLENVEESGDSWLRVGFRVAAS
jgi:hypothetical protein